MIQQKMKIDAPGATGAQAGLRPHHAPRYASQAASQSAPPAALPWLPWDTGGPAQLLIPGKKVCKRFFFFPRDPGMQGTPPPFAAEAQGMRKDFVYCLGRYRRQLL